MNKKPSKASFLSALAACIVWAFYPLCTVCARLTGCEYRLRSPAVCLLIGIALLLAAILFGGRRALCTAVLPLVCVCSGLVLIGYGDRRISLLVLCALISGIVLFIRSGCRMLFKLPLGLLSGLLCLCTLLMCILASLEFVAVESKAFCSPNGKYIAEVSIHDEGAPGGSTRVSVRPVAHIRGLWGEFCEKPKICYSGRWRNSIPEVEWIDDTRFIFEGESYTVD